MRFLILRFLALDTLIPGHETGGEVVKIGTKVTNVKIGDIVAIDPNQGCHKCDFCRRAQPHFCPKVILGPV